MWDLTRAPVRPDGEGRGATYVSDRVLFTGGKYITGDVAIVQRCRVLARHLLTFLGGLVRV